MLGASFDTIDENRAFAEKFSFPFLLLCDVERDIGLKYGATEEKESVYAKRISYLIGPDGSIAKVYAKVAPAAHPAQVLEDLIALQG